MTTCGANKKIIKHVQSERRKFLIGDSRYEMSLQCTFVEGRNYGDKEKEIPIKVKFV